MRVIPSLVKKSSYTLLPCVYAYSKTEMLCFSSFLQMDSFIFLGYRNNGVHI